MLISSRIKSGGFFVAAARAKRPSGNDRTSYPRCKSMSSSNFRLAGLSSTIIMSLSAIGHLSLSDARLLQQSRQVIVLVLVGQLLERPRGFGISSGGHSEDQLVQEFLVSDRGGIAEFLD